MLLDPCFLDDDVLSSFFSASPEPLDAAPQLGDRDVRLVPPARKAVEGFLVKGGHERRRRRDNRRPPARTSESREDGFSLTPFACQETGPRYLLRGYRLFSCGGLLLEHHCCITVAFTRALLLVAATHALSLARTTNTKIATQPRMEAKRRVRVCRRGADTSSCFCVSPLAP